MLPAGGIRASQGTFSSIRINGFEISCLLMKSSKNRTEKMEKLKG